MLEQTRQLAAIMFTDIVGYTALMQKDEKMAIETRKRHRKIFNRITGKYQGKILQYYGDGTLSIFGSAIDAVECGIEMQKEFQKNPKVPIRIGIHTGDVVFSEEEIIGDGVNVAARVESLAISGGVCISEKVYDEIKNQAKLSDAFQGVEKSNSSSFLYFSFITLLSIGYGDITPTTEFSQRLVVFFGLIGHFYTVFVIAIIVSKYHESIRQK